MPTLYQAVFSKQQEDYVALLYEKKSFTNAQCKQNVQRAITYLKERGVGKGDVVTLALPNIPATVFAFYAINALGAIANILHPLTPFNRILDSMEQVNSHHVLLLATLYGENKQKILRSGFTFLFVNPVYDNSLFVRKAFYMKVKKPDKAPNVFLFDEFRQCPCTQEIDEHPANQTSVYLHSGGTTGMPKTIELSDDAFNNLSDKMIAVLGDESLRRQDHGMMAVLPTFHGFGLGIGVHTPMKLGFKCVLFMKYDAKKILRAVDRGDITLMIGIPLLYQKLMNHPLFAKTNISKLTACYVGGDNVPMGLLSAFQAEMQKRGSHCQMYEGYGLTETVTVCNVNRAVEYRLGSVGKPLAGMVNMICDESGNILPANQIGEVYVGGNTLMNGYLNDAEATSKTMVLKNGTPMVRTGDLGYLDGDGFLFLKGRKKRVFKISGMNVYPAEIEKLVTDNNDVRDASLEFFATPKPHTVLFVMKEKESQKSEREIAERITRLIAGHELKYAMPQRVVFVNEFPQTEVGKINHSAFQDIQGK